MSDLNYLINLTLESDVAYVIPNEIGDYERPSDDEYWLYIQKPLFAFYQYKNNQFYFRMTERINMFKELSKDEKKEFIDFLEEYFNIKIVKY